MMMVTVVPGRARVPAAGLVRRGRPVAEPLTAASKPALVSMEAASVRVPARLTSGIRRSSGPSDTSTLTTLPRGTVSPERGSTEITWPSSMSSL